MSDFMITIKKATTINSKENKKEKLAYSTTYFSVDL